MRKILVSLSLGVLMLGGVSLGQTYQSGMCFDTPASAALISGSPMLHTGDTITAQCEIQNRTANSQSLTVQLSLYPPGSDTPVLTTTRDVFFILNLEKANVALSYTVPCPTGPTGYWTLKGTVAGCNSYQLPVTARVYVAPQPLCP